MGRPINLQAWCGIAVFALAIGWIVQSGLSHQSWVARLAREGSPPPTRDAHSKTGYQSGTRHFLAPQQRGETYRWIAATQEFIAAGPWAATTYRSDNVPEGRPQLLPRLYGAWLAAVAGVIHVTTGDPMGIAVEQAALWEPLVSHVLACAIAGVFMWRRSGPAAAAAAGLLFAVFPPVFGQFLPGVLTTTTWALLLAAYSIALNLRIDASTTPPPVLSIRSAIAASLALWLNPAFGFSAVVICAAAGIGHILTTPTRLPWLRWSCVGAAITLLAWVTDQAPGSPAAGELRSVHPWYALAWLGIGLALDGGQHLRHTDVRRRRCAMEIGAGLLLLTPLFATQLSYGYEGWLYSDVTMRRLTSLDETVIHNSALDWFARASLADAAFIASPLAAVLIALAWSVRRPRPAAGATRASLIVCLLVFGAVVVLALWKVRWSAVATLVALPLAWDLAAHASARFRRTALALGSLFCVGLMAWNPHAPPALHRPAADSILTRSDLEALVYRHFSHWLAAHTPGPPVSALAPPELSDSIVYHGGGRVLLSTAWESYPGHVAASRLLSAPEASEVEAVLQSLELTHVVVTSWDQVLPLLARDPRTEGKDTLYARLQRWVLPRYLRAIPYRLPAVPGYLDQKLAVFKVTAPQDDALVLSRLAEYFVEMDRGEPAGLVAGVLAESFADDPNAVIARATVYEHAKDQAAFDRELTRLTADATAGKVPFTWDRRVQRAILLALGNQRELARQEILACVATAGHEELSDLTALQAYRLSTLAGRYGASWRDPQLPRLAARLGAEYFPPPAHASSE